MRNWNADPSEDRGAEGPSAGMGRAASVRDDIEQHYEGRKRLAVLIWIAGLVWILVVLWINWQGWSGGTRDPLTAFWHIVLFAGIPGVVFYMAGRWVLRRSLTAQEEEESFHREAEFMQYFNRRGRATFGDIRDDFQLNEDGVRGFLIDLAGKRLLRGYVDWRNEEIVSIGEVEIEDECPGCGSPLNYLDPTVAVCDSCGLQVFK